MKVSQVLYTTSKLSLQVAALAILVQLVIQTTPRVPAPEALQITEMWDARNYIVV